MGVPQTVNLIQCPYLGDNRNNLLPCFEIAKFPLWTNTVNRKEITIKCKEIFPAYRILGVYSGKIS